MLPTNDVPNQNKNEKQRLVKNLNGCNFNANGSSSKVAAYFKTIFKFSQTDRQALPF